MILIGFLFFFEIIIIRAWLFTEIKWFMDIKNVSHNKILILYGFFGTVIYAAICGATDKMACKSNIEPNSICQISDYVCKIKANNNKTYFASFSIYFETFKTENSTSLEIIFEVLVEFITVICFFFENYCTISIIKFLTPIHYIVSLIYLLILNVNIYYYFHYHYYFPF